MTSNWIENPIVELTANTNTYINIQALTAI